MNFISLSIEESVQIIIEGAIIIDVREKSEYEQSHLEGSVLISLSELTANRIEEINQNKKEIIIYCRSGNRSKIAASKLIGQNYTGKIYEINDGITGWINENQPVSPK